MGSPGQVAIHFDRGEVNEDYKGCSFCFGGKALEREPLPNVTKDLGAVTCWHCQDLVRELAKYDRIIARRVTVALWTRSRAEDPRLPCCLPFDHEGFARAMLGIADAARAQRFVDESWRDYMNRLGPLAFDFERAAELAGNAIERIIHALRHLAGSHAHL